MRNKKPDKVAKEATTLVSGYYTQTKIKVFKEKKFMTIEQKTIYQYCPKYPITIKHCLKGR